MRREQRKQINLVTETTNKPKSPKSNSGTIHHYQVKTNGYNLYVRKGPSTSNEIIAKMPDKSKFDVIEIKNGWGKHAYIGTMGWSSLDWAVKIGETTKDEDKEEDKPPEDPPKTDGSEEGDCESILDGTIALREPDLTIKAKKGVTLKGLGSKLSGLYFIDEVTYKFDSGGLTQDIKVSREWIGESIKGGNPNTPPPKPPSPTKPEVEPPKEKRTYTVKKGDTLWGIAKKYYGEGSAYTKIFNANRDKINNPHLILPGWVLDIP